MGCCDCCVCCFRSLVLSAITFAFSIWGIADMVWISTGPKPTYIIAFICLLLILLGFIGLVIILFLKNDQNKETLFKVGKIISIVLLVLCGIALICFILSEIILIIKYADAESVISLPTRWWLTALFPGIMSIILIPIILKGANALYQICDKKIDCSLAQYKDTPKNPGYLSNIPGGDITITAPNVTITGQPVPIMNNQYKLGLNSNNPQNFVNNQLNSGQQ